MKWNLFVDGLVKGCGFTVGIGAGLAVIWVFASYFDNGLVNSGLVYFAAKINSVTDAVPNSTTSAQSLAQLGVDTIFESTIAYYNQIVTIMIFVASVSGVIAFAYIGFISREKAEKISEACAAKEVERRFGSRTFHDDIDQKLENIIFDSRFSYFADSFNKLKKRTEMLEKKYDRHDDLIQGKNEERALADQEVESIPDNQEDSE